MNTQLQAALQKAVQAFQGGNFDGADLVLQDALQNDINSVNAIFDFGIACAEANRFKEALIVLYCLKLYKSDDVRIPYNIGAIHSLEGNHKLALEAYDFALKLQPDCVEAMINIGAIHNEMKDYVLALEALDRAIKLNENYYEAYSNKGNALLELKRYDDAIKNYDKALSLKLDSCDVWTNKGVALRGLKQYDEAITHFDRALSLKPQDFESLGNKGVTLFALKCYDEAIFYYDKALTLKPDHAQTWSNKGVVLKELKRYDEAITHYNKALSLKPDHAEAWSNKGVVLHETHRYGEAITHFDQALSLNPHYHDALANKGVTLSELKRYDEAITHYDKALSLKPDIDWTSGDLLHTKMKICSWSDLEESLEDISKKVVANEKVITPFPLLALNDDALLHKKATQIFFQSRYPSSRVLESIPKRPQGKKIRVGYFSADFHNHATGYLMAELFELHNKSQFELIGFSFGPIANDEMRQRLKNSFDQFIEVGSMSDTEAAKLSRDLTIDIAVDLKGFTQDARTGIFSHRAAPIQVNYLGYPGTLGADYMDYIIADKTLIPVQSQQSYSEKVVYLPNSYQVNDRKRVISDKAFTRQELGLPETGFVFCCFNNNYKILPSTFEGWMRILKAVQGSVLWLFQDNFWAVENLKKEAEKKDISAERLVFAERLPLPEHLARHCQADLFLDTFPYNAHTTTSDALWAGLPVLTLTGQSFASRVAASLLNAIGLPELITSTQEGYEALAIELALNPKKLADIKLKLANNRLTTPLFDTPLFTKNLETAYIKMVERYRADLEPEHIIV
jgi:predicted O-linked N-acetylglucosamine transferase (SPINDLY family)